MKSLTQFILIIVSASVADVAVAEQPAAGRKPLLELYTSQACTLCPKANRQFAEFAQTHDVIALTFPVGYWDYLGWKDTFAQPAYGDRQKAYNEAMGRRGPYTPQVIFHGSDHCSATREKSMERKTEKASEETAPISISISYDGKTAGLSAPLPMTADVWVVEYLPGETFSTPSGGANAMKEMVYYNRVIGLTKAYARAGDTKIDAPCPTSCVAILQQEGHGEVLGAAMHEGSGRGS